MTTTPPTVTGFSRATGVSAPVRPTWMSIAVDRRQRLLGREFVRRRPARRARAEAEPLLQVELVDLVDDAVDIVVEIRRASARSRGNAPGYRRPQYSRFISGLTGKPQASNASTMPICVSAGMSAHLAPGIGKEVAAAARGDLGIELAQRARGRVARIDEGLLALGLHLRVERQEIALGHVDLAAHLDDIGRARRQLLRDFA